MDSFNAGQHESNLVGKVCPYPVVHIIREVERMKPGERRHFMVDDPLAVKSIPVELDEYDDLTFDIVKVSNGMWIVQIQRQE